MKACAALRGGRSHSRACSCARFAFISALASSEGVLPHGRGGKKRLDEAF